LHRFLIIFSFYFRLIHHLYSPDRSLIPKPHVEELTMTRFFHQLALVVPVCLAIGPPVQATDLNPAPDNRAVLQEITEISREQVTSVSQLKDVAPTDWAFQALQSLTERYGCIAGYPDGTFRGSRAMTRYEFAAGLNACLDRVNELIASATADLVTKQDLAVLQKLQEEFQAELATLRGRVDALEATTAELKAKQFSTTTKLSGETIFNLASASGAAPDGDNANTVFNSRVRLNLMTSFSGKDLLITGLQAHNFGGGGNSIAGALGYGDPVFNENSNVRLGTEPQFPSTDPKTLSAIAPNSFNLYKLLYIFPAAPKLTAFVGSHAEVSDAFPSILPFASEGQGSVSRFGNLPASHRVSGGTSGIGLASAAGLIWTPSKKVDLRLLYGSVNANLASNQGFPGTPLGAGIFGGSYIAATQLTLTPVKRLQIGLNYAHSYHQINILGTGLSQSDVGSILFPTTGGVGAIAKEGIKLNTFGATAAYELNNKITLAGTATYINSSLVDVNASTNFLSWMIGTQIKDVFKTGNTAGLIFGQPLSRKSVGGLAYKPEDATPYHLEGYLNIKVSDNINITPGVVVLFKPEGFESSNTVFMPVIRTTFKI
jgi:hypothetical protein